MFVRQHVHHSQALSWYARLDPAVVGVCRQVQLSAIRLLGNRAVMGDFAVPAAEGWRMMQEFQEDERVEFLPEPSELDTVLPALLNHPVAAANLLSDAFLAAFAIAASRRFVTFDRNFTRFKGLDLQLLV